MLFSFGNIAAHKVDFAEMCMCAAVPGIKDERLLIMPHSRVELPQTAIGIAEIVLNIGIAVVAQSCRGERLDGAIPVPPAMARLPAAKSGSSAAQSALSANNPMDEQIGQASAVIAASSEARSLTCRPCRAGGSKRKPPTLRPTCRARRRSGSSGS